MNDSLKHLPEFMRFIKEYIYSMEYFLDDEHTLNTLLIRVSTTDDQHNVGRYDWFLRLVSLGVLIDCGEGIREKFHIRGHRQFDVSPAYKDALIVWYML